MNNLKNMERDILQAALDGPLKLGTLGGDKLISKYRDVGDEEGEGRRLTLAINDLVNEGYLHPYHAYKSDGTRETTAFTVRGITFKGMRRCRELRHPRFMWAERNWFPLTIAATTAAVPIVTKLIWG